MKITLPLDNLVKPIVMLWLLIGYFQSVEFTEGIPADVFHDQTSFCDRIEKPRRELN